MTPAWIQAVYYVYEIPLILMYILIVYVLYKKKTCFSSVFYKFVIIFGIQDIILYFVLQYQVRFPMSSVLLSIVFKGVRGTPSIILFIRLSLEFNGLISTIVLASIRISSMVSPVNHARIWTKATAYVIALNIVIPTCLYGFLVFNKATLLCAEEENILFGCIASYDHSVTWDGTFSVSKINKYMYTIIPTIAAILNLIAVVLLYTRKKAFKIRKTWRQEINLTISSFFTFGAHVSYGILHIVSYNYFTSRKTVTTIFLSAVIVPLVFDVILLTTVLSLLTLSEDLRTELGRILIDPWRRYGKRERGSWTRQSSVRITPLTK